MKPMSVVNLAMVFSKWLNCCRSAAVGLFLFWARHSAVAVLNSFHCLFVAPPAFIVKIDDVTRRGGPKHAMSQKIPPDCFLSFAQVAEIIGLDEQTLRNGECGTDELLRIKLGTRTLCSFNGVQAWIERRVRQARDDRQRQAEIEAMNPARKKMELLQRKQFVKDRILRITQK